MPSAERLGPIGYGTPPGLRRLHDHLLARFPGTHSGGMFNPNSVLDSGAPSPHQVTQAVDIMCDRLTATRIIRYLVDIAGVLNLQQVIAWHEVVTVARWSEGIRSYPSGDHSDGNGHAHIHIGWNAALHFDASWIGAAPPPQGDDDLQPDERQALLEIRQLLADAGRPGVLADIHRTLGMGLHFDPSNPNSAWIRKISDIHSVIARIQGGFALGATATDAVVKRNVGHVVNAAKQVLGVTT